MFEFGIKVLIMLKTRSFIAESSVLGANTELARFRDLLFSSWPISPRISLYQWFESFSLSSQKVMVWDLDSILNPE